MTENSATTLRAHFTMKMSLRNSIAIAFGLSSLALTQSAYGFSTYFGEDLNTSETTPLTNLLNSNAAQSQFLSGLVGVGTENFEGFATNSSAPFSLNFGEAGTATLSGSGSIKSVASGTSNGFGRYAVSGTKFVEANAEGGQFAVNFSKATAAFGFYGVDIGDFGGTLNLILALANGGTKSLTVNNTMGSNASTGGSALFYGLIADNEDELFTSIAFDMSIGQGDMFAFDKMTIGSWEQVVKEEPPTPVTPPVTPPETPVTPPETPKTPEKPAEGSTSVPEPSVVLGLLAFAGVKARQRG